MNTYLDMWDRVKRLNHEETNNLLIELRPAKGVTVQFKGLAVIDVDLIEALNYWEVETRPTITYPLPDQQDWTPKRVDWEQKVMLDEIRERMP